MVDLFNGRALRVAACNGVTAVGTTDGEVHVIGRGVQGSPFVNAASNLQSLSVSYPVIQPILA